MKILCPNCFNPVTIIKGNRAQCKECGLVYDLNEQSTRFRARLEGGYVKSGMTKDELVKFIAEGKILPDEYIASEDGPWLSVSDSPFADMLPDKKDEAGDKSSVMLYAKKKVRKSIIFKLSFLLFLSIFVNLGLLLIIYFMKLRLNELVSKISGG